MKQTVTVIQLADRHAEAHSRQFAGATDIVVEAGTLAEVIARAMLIDFPVGRYTLCVSEPYE